MVGSVFAAAPTFIDANTSIASDNSTVTVVFDMNVNTTSGWSCSDFNLSITGGTATLNGDGCSAISPTNGYTDTIIITLGYTEELADGTEVLTIAPTTNSIYADNNVSNYMSTSENTTATLNDTTPPEVTSITTDTSVYSNDENIILTMVFDANVSSLEIDFSNVDSEVDSNYTLNNVTVNSDGNYSITHTISADNTITDGTYDILVTAEDDSNNAVTDSNSVSLDNDSPSVSEVTASTGNGSYNAGDTIAIQVVFSESVDVNTGDGTPYLTLETGTTDRNATYTSGSGSSTLVFNYVVQAGDSSLDLDYLSTASLDANSGTIKDVAEHDANLTLPEVGSEDSLSGNKAIIIDTTAPTITNVTSSTANGYYNAGDVISIQITFTEEVTVTGSPLLTLETGTTDENAIYASGSGASTLDFNYTVQAGDTTSDLNYISTSALVLNSGTIRDAAGNNVTLTLPSDTNTLAENKAIIIDTTAPSAPATPTTDVGTTVNAEEKETGVSVDVNFSETNAVEGDILELLLGGESFDTALIKTLDENDLSDGVYTFTIDSNQWGDDGNKTLNAIVTDLAGNESDLSEDLNLTVDSNTPSDYSVSFDGNYANDANETAISFTFAGAEVGTTYNYSINDTNADTNAIEGTGTISGATQNIAGLDLSSLSDGTITLTVTLTDGAGNVGEEATDTIIKDIVAPELQSAAKDSETQITVTFNEEVSTNETNPTDFDVVDSIGNTFAVSAQADGTAGDDEIVLTVANMTTSVGDLTLTYTNDHNEVSDLAGNYLATDDEGISIDSVNFVSVADGYNFFALPKNAVNNTVDSVFGDINGTTVVYDYNTDSELFTAMSSDDNVNTLNGYIVYADNSGLARFTYDTTILSIPGTKELTSGWNLVGNSNTATTAVMTILAGCISPTNGYYWDNTMQFNSTTQVYETAVVAGNASNVDVGEAFWVNIKNGESCTIAALTN